MITATLRAGNIVKHINLTYDIATCLRDDPWTFNARLNALGVSMELHFPVGDETIDNIPELYEAAADLADEATWEAQRRSE